MGICVYKLTGKVINLEGGITAQVAVFAYKPTFCGFDAEKWNRAAARATGCNRPIKVRSINIAIVHDDECEVFRNEGGLSVFYDDLIGRAEHFPKVGGFIKDGKLWYGPKVLTI
jgi:hypothetical protein